MDSPEYPKETIKSIAEQIDMGMICFLNTDTMEVESVLGKSYYAYSDTDFEGSYREVYDKVENWEHSLRIDPPESWQSFKIMEDFIENCIPYRQCWFDFKQMQLEKFVQSLLS